MKLRVKLRGQSRPIDFGETDISGLTLSQLKVSVSDAFLLENGNVELSLNKTDVLVGDEITLSDLGIVPGDLIHVVTSDSPQEIPGNRPSNQRQQPIASVSAESTVVSLDRNQHSNSNDDESQKNDQSSQTTVSASLSENPAAHDSTTSSHPDQAVEADRMEVDVPRPLHEPLVIGESTPSQVPILLSELYSRSNITSSNDALFVVLHALMIESGFSPPENVDITTLPSDWKKPGYYMCMYDYVLTPDVVLECCLMAVPTGSSMAVHGLSKKLSNFKTDHLQVKAENYVRDISKGNAPDAYRSLDRLAKVFKDNICLALQNHLAISAGFRETQGLLSLPCEVRMRLMCFLDARSVCKLGQTCHQWRSIYKDNLVWRRLYLQSFETPTDSSLSRNWYEMFKARYVEYFEQRERRRYFMSMDDFDLSHFPGRPFNPMNPTYPFPPPRFLGGDYDLQPEFEPGIPDLMNHHQGPSSRRMLPRVPDPFMNGRLARGRGRGNLTGSPFFRNGPFM